MRSSRGPKPPALVTWASIWLVSTTVVIESVEDQLSLGHAVRMDDALTPCSLPRLETHQCNSTRHLSHDRDNGG